MSIQLNYPAIGKFIVVLSGCLLVSILMAYLLPLYLQFTTFIGKSLFFSEYTDNRQYAILWMATLFTAFMLSVLAFKTFVIVKK